MKYLLLIVFININFCAISQNIYVKIDTRKKEICDTSVWDNSNCIGGKQVSYVIYKTVPEKQFESQLMFLHHPFTKEYVKGSITKAHRTVKMLKTEFKSNLMFRELALVIDFEWIEAHSWFVIDWMARAAKHIYIIDEKFSTKDSLQIREVDYFDTATQE